MVAQPPPPPAAGQEGLIGTVIHAVKGLTLTNVLVIVLLVVALLPAYIAYRALNDEVMLSRILSSYREVPNPVPGSTCLLREISVRGGGDTWGLSTGFAYFGDERWLLSVQFGSKPTNEELESHCQVLELTVDWMRDPTEHEIPKVPGTDDPLVWQYPLEDRGYHPIDPQ